MSLLFTSSHIGNLELPNRLVRSATAESLVDSHGRPLPALKHMYQDLARGGVGLIITGHMFVHPSGRADPEMTGIYSDELIPSLAELADVVHREGGLVAAQINHGGMQCKDPLSETIAPSAVDTPALNQPAREMTTDEIYLMIDAYGQAARRAKEAGFDAVQVHAAHGYLNSQFLSPFVNRRTDEWGGDVDRRMNFLRAVCRAVREQVGPDYPVFIKLGMMDDIEGGLTPEESVQIVAALEDMGLDALEISGAISGSGQARNLNVREGVVAGQDEAYFRPLAQKARSATRLPVLLVGGIRSREMMDEILDAGDADFISLSRPLLCEPDLPNRMRLRGQEESACIAANYCWPEKPGDGIACRCPIVKPL
jgi:2,4-dienoyl-CoA reductase-like NADH-dependent reductase (Old Yellow Enzyme family)